MFDCIAQRSSKGLIELVLFCFGLQQTLIHLYGLDFKGQHNDWYSLRAFHSGQYALSCKNWYWISGYLYGMVELLQNLKLPKTFEKLDFSPLFRVFAILKSVYDDSLLSFVCIQTLVGCKRMGEEVLRSVDSQTALTASLWNYLFTGITKGRVGRKILNQGNTVQGRTVWLYSLMNLWWLLIQGQ